MDEKRKTKLSKFLSLILRHQPEAINLNLDSNGWADVEELLEKSARNGNAFTLEELKTIVKTSDKKRFAFDASSEKIRANQGHSIDVEIGFEKATPPPILYHGTAEKNVEAIMQNGLQKKQRHHVHLSNDRETARAVGARYGKPVILQIDAGRMMESNFEFYVSANGVWLVDSVPSEFLKVI